MVDGPKEGRSKERRPDRAGPRLGPVLVTRIFAALAATLAFALWGVLAGWGVSPSTGSPAEDGRSITSRDGSARVELPPGWHLGQHHVALFTFTTYARPHEPRSPGFCSGEPIPAGQVLIQVSDVPLSKKAEGKYPSRPGSFRFPGKVRRGCRMIYDFTFRDNGRLINLWVWANLGLRGRQAGRPGERPAPHKATVRPSLLRQIESLFDSLEFRSPVSHPAMAPSFSRKCRSLAAGPCGRRVDVSLQTRLPMTAVSVQVRGRTVRLTPDVRVFDDPPLGGLRSRFWAGYFRSAPVRTQGRSESMDVAILTRRPGGAAVRLQRFPSLHIEHCRPRICR